MCEISATSEPSCSISGAFLISRLRKESLVITFSTMTSPFLPLPVFAPVALVARLAPVCIAATATPHLPSHRSRAHRSCARPNLSQGYPNTRPNSNACSMACQAGKLNQSMQNSGPSVDRNARAGPQDTRGVRLSLPFPQRGWLTMKYTRF